MGTVEILSKGHSVVFVVGGVPFAVVWLAIPYSSLPLCVGVKVGSSIKYHTSPESISLQLPFSHPQLSMWALVNFVAKAVTGVTAAMRAPK